ncbi:hypothetical protein HU200_044266 [Digitaria exilis]|uniref:Uncharacterized protein n=1 Tax=Digitaria exilis TaxID=1010633 RepID=A0A835BCZ7_9POAL|nr:hypothetical protein HU200_044266 [Digitaria exilis]
MSSRVRVVGVSHVLPATGADGAAAGSPLLPDDHLLKLSFVDCLFVAVVPMQRLFFYQGPSVPAFPCVVNSLRSSLAAALRHFLPLAGKIAYYPPSSTAAGSGLVVDCSPGAVSPGVSFVEAQFAGTIADMRRVASGEEHDPEALARLGPELEAGRLPAPVLAVQVTRPADDHRGVVVGVSIHHAVADGHSVWQFMRAWSAVSRSSQGLVPRPTFDRAVIRHPEADELASKFLRTFAPALPMVRSSRPTLDLDQRRMMEQSVAIGKQLDKHPSTYVAVSLPGVGEGYFGNCLSLSFARAAARDLMRPDAGMAHAAAAIREVARETVASPLRGAERWAEAYAGMPRESFTPSGSSNRFMAYETDMGWGAPTQVELGSLSGKRMVLLLGAPNGAVQVTVALDHAHMDRFAANFMQT